METIDQKKYLVVIDKSATGISETFSKHNDFDENDDIIEEEFGIDWVDVGNMSLVIGEFTGDLDTIIEEQAAEYELPKKYIRAYKLA